MIQVKKKVTVPFTELDGSDAGATFTAHERASFDVAQRSAMLLAKSRASTDVVEARLALREAEEILVMESVTALFGVQDEDGSNLAISKWRDMPPLYCNQLIQWLLDRNRLEYIPELDGTEEVEQENPNAGQPSDSSSKGASGAQVQNGSTKRSAPSAGSSSRG